jgi:hypothetical protein
MRCLSFKADARPATMEQVRLELEGWLARQPRRAGRPELAALLKVVPAEPMHAIETTPSGKQKKVGTGKVARLNIDSTLRPAPPEPVGKVGDETFRSSRRISSEFLMKEFNEDGSRAEKSTDVERKGLGPPTGPVPEQSDEQPTMFEPGPQKGVPTLRSDEGDLMKQIEAATRSAAKTERTAAVKAPPPGFVMDPVGPETEDEPEHITEKPSGPHGQPVSDVTLIPRKSALPMILSALGFVAVAVGVYFFLLRH